MSALAQLAAMPVFWLALTCGTFALADVVSHRLGRHPAAHPIILSCVLLALLLIGTRTPYQTYADGTAFLSFLLGPATVALAVPLWRNWDAVKRTGLAIAAALLAGSLTAIVSVVGIAWAMGASPQMLHTLAPRSVTTPVAIALSQSFGGIPALSVVAVMVSGIFGAIIATPMFNRMGFRDPRARGFAVGISAHGLGTNRAYQVSETAGVFAGVALALNAALTSILLGLAALLI